MLAFQPAAIDDMDVLIVIVAVTLAASAAIAAMLLRRPGSTALVDAALVGAWQSRAAQLTRKLEESPNDGWAWLWRARLRIITFILRRVGVDAAVSADESFDSGASSVPSPPVQESVAAFTKEPPDRKLTWTPPWSKQGESLSAVLTRVQHSASDRDQELAKSDERFNRMVKRIDRAMVPIRVLLVVCMVGALTASLLGVLAVSLAYYPASWALLDGGLNARVFGELHALNVWTFALLVNTVVATMIAMDRNRSALWGLGALLGTAMVAILCLSRSKPSSSIKPRRSFWRWRRAKGLTAKN